MFKRPVKEKGRPPCLGVKAQPPLNDPEWAQESLNELKRTSISLNEPKCAQMCLNEFKTILIVYF